MPWPLIGVQPQMTAGDDCPSAGDPDPRGGGAPLVQLWCAAEEVLDRAADVDANSGEHRGTTGRATATDVEQPAVTCEGRAVCAPPQPARRLLQAQHVRFQPPDHAYQRRPVVVQ